MSSNSSDFMATTITSLCSCHLCKNIFKHPIILPCFHSFCLECLNQHVSQQKSQEGPQTFSCPVCSRRTMKTDTASATIADQPKVDTFITNLQVVVEALGGDKKCDICQRGKEQHQMASCWCVNCCDALCQDCSKVHLYGRTTSPHNILTMSEMQQMSLQSVMRATSSQRCPKHQEDVVKLFCLDCEQPVCVQCLASTHRTCERCVSVAEARLMIQGDITEIMGRLQAEVTESSKERVEPLTLLKHFDENIKQTEAEIRSVADKLRQRITECEEDLIQKLHSISSSLNEKTNYVQNIEESGNDGSEILVSARKRMTDLLKYGSDFDVLDIYHRIKAISSIVDGKRSNESINDTVKFKINFDIDNAVQIFMRDFERLGDIRVEDCGHDEGLSSWGVTVTSHDEIVVTHRRYKRVQKFTGTGSLVDHIQLNEEPQDITNYLRHDVAITVMKKQILLLTVSGKLDLKRWVETQRQYGGIAYNSNNHSFVVSSLEENCIDVITSEGEITKTFSLNYSEMEPGLNCPKYVTFTREGHIIVSDTAHNSVTCVSQDGTLVFTYAPSDGAHDLKTAQGVCCDKNGNVFVADYGNSRIHLLTSNGHFQRFVLGHDSKLRRPVALTMTESNKLVVVQSDGMVKVFSYEGNQAQGENREIPKGQLSQSRHRFYSSSLPSVHQTGKGIRSLSVSSNSQSTAPSLSHHIFRSRHI